MSNYGRRAFSFAGPHTWNSLPNQLRTSAAYSYVQTLTEDIFIWTDYAFSAL